MLKKIVFWLIGIIAVFVCGFLVFVFSTYDRTYDDQYPVSDLNVEIDSARIARGKYLAYGPAHCVDCHAPYQKRGVIGTPLIGGLGLELPPAKFNAPNITPDPETGIGRFSDGHLYRMLRYNIRPNGRLTVDLMPFVNMSEEDIFSVIAFLRSQKPVKMKAPETEWTFIGKMLLALGAIKPSVPDQPLLEKIDEDTTAEYGRYLAYSVANCRGCHTNRDLKTGEYIGENYAGGLVFGPDNLSMGWVYTTPNLTPDDETGYINTWTEKMFLDRIRKGRGHMTSPMPWEAFQNMKENDLKAVYKFLKQLAPVSNRVMATATAPKK